MAMASIKPRLKSFEQSLKKARDFTKKYRMSGNGKAKLLELFPKTIPGWVETRFVPPYLTPNIQFNLPFPQMVVRCPYGGYIG